MKIYILGYFCGIKIYIVLGQNPMKKVFSYQNKNKQKLQQVTQKDKTQESPSVDHSSFFFSLYYFNYFLPFFIDK
jgi:hypothetical protein